jgi:hypothetical protein
MLAASIVLGVCAYRVHKNPEKGILIALSIVAFLFAALTFGDVIVRVDKLEGIDHNFLELRAPFENEENTEE